jgi:hypothetical protein
MNAALRPAGPRARDSAALRIAIRILFTAAPFLFLFLAPGLPPPGPGHANPQKPIIIGLRYDDCSALSPETLERSILAACERYGIPITFGVIPAVGAGDLKDPEGAGTLMLPPERQAMLRDAMSGKILETAMHGYSHRVARKGDRTEFAGVTARIQDERLRDGRTALKPVDPVPATFIPPWNSYDERTLAALSRNGFTVVSAIVGGPAPHNALMSMVPATCLIPGLRAAVAAARREGGGIVVPYFHPYEFKEQDSVRGLFTFAEFEQSLAWLSAQPDVQALGLRQIGSLEGNGRDAYLAYSHWRYLTPAFLEKTLRPAYRVYPHAALPVAGGGILLALIVLSWYAVIALAGFLLSRAAARVFLKGTGAEAFRILGLVMALASLLACAAGVHTAALAWTSIWSVVLGYGLGLWSLPGHPWPAVAEMPSRPSGASA